MFFPEANPNILKLLESPIKASLQKQYQYQPKLLKYISLVWRWEKHEIPIIEIWSQLPIVDFTFEEFRSIAKTTTTPECP